MAIRVEHEIHQRRRGRNYGLGLILVAFVALIFGLTVVKVTQLGDAHQFESFDHVARPQIEPPLDAEGTDAAPAAGDAAGGQ